MYVIASRVGMKRNYLSLKDKIDMIRSAISLLQPVTTSAIYPKYNRKACYCMIRTVEKNHDVVKPKGNIQLWQTQVAQH